jgi:NADH-quinone oxidoreductase subunit M
MLTGILIILPLVFSLAVFAMKDEKQIRTVAIAGALAEFLLSLYALFIYVTQCHCLLLLDYGRNESMGISLRFGMDGLSLLLVLLTTFLTPLIIWSSFRYDYRRPSAFYGLILLMEMAFIGVFTAFDGLVFYIFWELALIPAWFICAAWGGNDRIRITFKFFIYTFTGSLFMLVALIWLYFRTPVPHSFAISALYTATLTPSEQAWIFAAFFLAFAIKIPIFPFHTWQPDTYAESPPAGTMLLAGIMLKMGTYGLLRFLIPVCHGIISGWGIYLVALAVTGIIYASIIAIRQNDLKRLIAWSSIAHVGLIAAGSFALNAIALEGAVIQMVSHGINITGLFIMAGMLEQRTGGRQISGLGGIASRAPWFAAFFMIILLASIALPLTNGFIGEFMLLLGIFRAYAWMALPAGLTVIFSAVYMLWMYQRVMLGEQTERTAGFADLTNKEWLILVPLVIMIFWIGIFPGFFLKMAGPAIQEILMVIK